MQQNQLTFIVSQPRSGSTLLQRILGSNKDIYTRSEPWLMLSPSYQLKGSGINAEYESHLANKAFLSFIKDLADNGREYYLEELRKFLLSLYGKYLENKQETIFLDKTPRYYLIIDELLEIFPESKIIILFRNPLAVLNSMLQTWVGDEIIKLSNYQVDLLKAPDQMLKHKFNSNVLSIQYEKLISKPESTLREICNYLGITYSEEMLRYANTGDEAWELGDQSNAFKQNKISDQFIDKWKLGITNKQNWRLFLEYYNYLGNEKIEMLGYDPDDIEQTLNNHFYNEQKDKILKSTLSLNNVLYGKEITQNISTGIESLNKTISELTKICKRNVSMQEVISDDLSNTLKTYINDIDIKDRTLKRQAKTIEKLEVNIDKLINDIDLKDKALTRREKTTEQLEDNIKKLINDIELLKNSKTFKVSLVLKKILMPWR